MKPFIYLLLIVAGIVGCYYAFDYVKERPPDFLVKLLTLKPPPPALPAGVEAPIIVPQEFSATIFARDLAGVRVLARDQKGTMLASQTDAGKVVALPDTDGNGVADKTVTILEGLNDPHGLAVICKEACMLYVAETDEINSYAYDAERFVATDKKMIASLPSGSGHYTRTLLEHPDGEHLLVSVGSSCNVCNEKDPVRASVQSIDLTTGKMETFASGLRNTVFMAINPVDGKIWGTDNGRDLIGDDIPPDEINIIEQGKRYGWPICYGQNIHDTDFDKNLYVRDPCADTTPAHIDLQAHSAALGLAFIPEEGWPAGWGNDLLVAYHGSWNRSEATGYKVVRFDFMDNGVRNDQFPADFVTGFLKEGEKDPIGRPVAIMAEPGGTAYISDDRAGAIYKISLKEPAY